MANLADLDIATQLLGANGSRAGALLAAIAAGEAAVAAICRLDCAAGQLAQPRIWLLLEELAGLAAAARAAGEQIDFVDLVRDRLGLRSAGDLTLDVTTRELAERWTGGDHRERREQVVAELLRTTGAAAPASLISLALRLEEIARDAGWQMLPARRLRIDPDAGAVSVTPGGDASVIGDYTLAQAFAFERMGLAAQRLPGVLASPALLLAADDGPAERLCRWLRAVAASAEAARRRLDRYHRFEQRIHAALSEMDKRRRSALATLLALFADHWVLWPKRAAMLSGIPHNSVWRAMNEAEHRKLICRLPGRFAGGASMYVLTIVAEAAGLRPQTEGDPLPSPGQGELQLDAISELDAAEADIDRLIGGGERRFFSLDDVEL